MPKLTRGERSRPMALCERSKSIDQLNVSRTCVPKRGKLPRPSKIHTIMLMTKTVMNEYSDTRACPTVFAPSCIASMMTAVQVPDGNVRRWSIIIFFLSGKAKKKPKKPTARHHMRVTSKVRSTVLPGPSTLPSVSLPTTSKDSGDMAKRPEEKPVFARLAQATAVVCTTAFSCFVKHEP